MPCGRASARGLSWDSVTLELNLDVKILHDDSVRDSKISLTIRSCGKQYLSR